MISKTQKTPFWIFILRDCNFTFNSVSKFRFLSFFGFRINIYKKFFSRSICLWLIKLISQVNEFYFFWWIAFFSELSPFLYFIFCQPFLNIFSLIRQKSVYFHAPTCCPFIIHCFNTVRPIQSNFIPILEHLLLIKRKWEVSQKFTYILSIKIFRCLNLYCILNVHMISVSSCCLISSV